MNLSDRARKKIKPDPASIQALSRKIDFLIDLDYWEFITNHNGGYIDFANEYLALWTVEDVTNLNPYFKDDLESNNFLFFGSNGSSSGYAFDKLNGGIVAIDYYQWGEEEPEFVGDSFLMFLERLSLR